MIDGEDDNGIDQDGSLEAAVASMPDLSKYGDVPADKPERNLPTRADDGKFTKAEQEAAAVAEKAAPVEEQVADDDEDYVELAADEEGKEPARYKLSEVLEGFQKAKTLESELENVRKVAPVPTDYEQALRETVTKQITYTNALAEWARYNQPQEPDRSLIDPQSPNYDPELYGQQLRQNEQLVAQRRTVKAEYDRLTAQTLQEQQILDRAYEQREASKRAEIWPEYETKAGREKAYADVAKHYGLDKEALDEVRDHRAVKIIRDALAYQALQTKQQAAVKIVKAKPKLIPSQARGTGNNRATQASEAMNRLAKSHDIDDGIAALSKILN